MRAASFPPPARPPVPGAPAGVTAFVDVTAVPMDTARVLPRQTVLVQHGWITALGPSGQVRIPAGAVRIDGRGKFLIPGLGDCHAHIGAGSFHRQADLPPDSVAAGRLLRWLADGVTTIRNLDYTDKDRGFMLNGADALRLRAQAAAGELWSPRIYTAGQWGPEQYVWSSVEQSVPLRLDSIEAYLAAYKAAGYDFVKTHNESPEVFDSVLAAARRVGIPVVGHVMSTLPHALAGGMQSLEHMIGYPGDLLHPDSIVPDSQARALAAATRDAGVWNCVTMQAGGFGHEKLVKALQDAGAGLLLGSDFPLGLGVHWELELLVQKAGLTPYEALATGTKNFGTYLRTLDPTAGETGRIAVGQRADLVLLEGNPLEDITNVKRRAGVMLGGRWFTRDELEQRLLAFPYYGLITELQRFLRSRALPYQQVSEPMNKLRDLSDSLVVAQAKPAEYERVVQRLAAELGAMRTLLAAEQHAAFDSVAHVWLRAQARQGYHMGIPRVTPTP